MPSSTRPYRRQEAISVKVLLYRTHLQVSGSEGATCSPRPASQPEPLASCFVRASQPNVRPSSQPEPFGCPPSSGITAVATEPFGFLLSSGVATLGPLAFLLPPGVAKPRPFALPPRPASQTRALYGFLLSPASAQTRPLWLPSFAPATFANPRALCFLLLVRATSQRCRPFELLLSSGVATRGPLASSFVRRRNPRPFGFLLRPASQPEALCVTSFVRVATRRALWLPLRPRLATAEATLGFSFVRPCRQTEALWLPSFARRSQPSPLSYPPFVRRRNRGPFAALPPSRPASPTQTAPLLPALRPGSHRRNPRALSLPPALPAQLANERPLASSSSPALATKTQAPFGFLASSGVRKPEPLAYLLTPRRPQPRPLLGFLLASGASPPTEPFLASSFDTRSSQTSPIGSPSSGHRSATRSPYVTFPSSGHPSSNTRPLLRFTSFAPRVRNPRPFGFLLRPASQPEALWLLSSGPLEFPPEHCTFRPFLLSPASQTAAPLASSFAPGVANLKPFAAYLLRPRIVFRNPSALATLPPSPRPFAKP
ncbi:hypothetical protein C7M84_000913 [Penaeus vannamei]|uniref:Uncharacterized protein n=1 Tax=Penaeus vannamei TaxID=6689 RepID=A0A3R7SXS4_PENVA|nr:hypothetical protein C7M84_000913 [Penaeus vannamei]